MRIDISKDINKNDINKNEGKEVSKETGVKIISDAIYRSYALRQHARCEYVYTWTEERKGKLTTVANNAYYHNDFRKVHGDYEPDYDTAKLGLTENLEFVGMIDDFIAITEKETLKYNPKDVFRIPTGMRSEIHYRRKDAKPDLETIKQRIAYRLEKNEYALVRAKQELEIIKQWDGLIDSDEEWLLEMYEDSDMLFNLDYFKQTHTFATAKAQHDLATAKAQHDLATAKAQHDLATATTSNRGIGSSSVDIDEED